MPVSLCEGNLLDKTCTGLRAQKHSTGGMQAPVPEVSDWADTQEIEKQVFDASHAELEFGSEVSQIDPLVGVAVNEIHSAA